GWPGAIRSEGWPAAGPRRRRASRPRADRGRLRAGAWRLLHLLDRASAIPNLRITNNGFANCQQPITNSQWHKSKIANSRLASERRRGYAGRMKPKLCPDCDGGDVLSRREFLHTAVTGVAGVAALTALPAGAVPASAAPAAAQVSSETLVATFYKSLTEAQRK